MKTSRLCCYQFTIFVLIVFLQLNCNSPEVVGRFDGAIKPQSIRAHLQILSDDIMEGRAPGTRGGQIAAKYIASQFQEAGLLPAVGDSSYFQNVQLVGVKPTATLFFRVRNRLWRLIQGTDFVARTKIEDPRVSLQTNEMIFMGYGIDAPEYNWNDYKNVDVTGKTLLILVNEPQSENSDFFNGKALTYYGRWTYKYEEAARKGADAVILIHTTPSAGYGWNVIQNSQTRELFHLKMANDSKRPLLFEGWLREEIADEIFTAVGLNFNELIVQANLSSFEPISIPVIVRAFVTNEIRTIESPNVIAKLDGTDPDLKKECILYTSHYDHLGRSNLPGDDIFNGAFDNASGTASLISIAHAFAKSPIKAKRSILFAAVTAEESGLLGSQFYTENPLFPLPRTAANINIDAVNVWGKTRDIIAMGAERSSIFEVVNRVAKDMQIEISPEPMPEQGYFFRSDQFSFVKKGVPAVFLKGGLSYLDKPEGWGRQLMDDYIKNRYHGVKDEYDRAWSLEGAAQVAQFALKTGMMLANMSSMPTWNDGDPFKKIRQQSLVEAVE